MNKIPGFNAEASIYKKVSYYQQVPTDFIEKSDVHPALRISRGTIGVPLGATCTSTDGGSTCACKGSCWAGEEKCGCVGTTGLNDAGTVMTF